MGGVSCVAPVAEEAKKGAGEVGRNIVDPIRRKTEFPHETEEILSRRNYF
jgi:hypothetical protein